jgi:hypothetical protein
VSAPTFAFWTSLLGLLAMKSSSARKESNLRRSRIPVAPSQRLGVCPHCGDGCDTVHQTRTRQQQTHAVHHDVAFPTIDVLGVVASALLTDVAGVG